ncbi:MULTISPECIES: membrane protein insertion efficiency factor YidD [Curtobacterium]|jgi:putative membrane protein insertion efficiency factor|uniref:membrane protein insertion efficiency factor YidD n=1 Tax=Curtobacterium TaxID=2034 RepID=UPI000D940C0E|nr:MULTISPECIES: membrane protein insertion efficiency factor YidD [Curtobacterium]MBO9038334.1 membrane protein insertion efficiency factor YidD [Curtobacterium flaccumfaciens pv. flaccumfaciens]MCS6552806.1 membrane protein insertion efficiency factor YidD [Curtobacterium flaccumfaciens pv. flaccumfaciens]PYY61623.1 membrane protein insertion efficiency factor YidD [Curtobacterium sp. MCPF17_003]PZE64164.1 membrane protein insertion efficiency factor YidD [Curtobacterium sp. MCPF17_018]PZF26
MNRTLWTRLAWVIALLPRNACVVVLRAYRAVISPLYGNVCRYHPSCSRYALEAIQQYGVVRGSAMGAWRIARCNPWAAGGIDDVKERRHPFVVNRFGFVLAPIPQQPHPAVGTARPVLLPQRTRKA